MLHCALVEFFLKNFLTVLKIQLGFERCIRCVIFAIFTYVYLIQNQFSSAVKKFPFT